MRQLTSEEMNKLILERVPLEERLKAVYLPIIAMDCACYLSEDLLTVMSETKLESTKKMSRLIRNYVQTYREENKRIMQSKLYENLTNSTKDFYKSLSQNMLIHKIQYRQAILSRGLDFSEGVTQMIATAYVVRKLVRFVLELDREFSNRISALLGNNIKYTTQDNQHCIGLDKVLSEMLDILDVSQFDLETSQTEMAFKVFKNKLHTVKIWLYK